VLLSREEWELAKKVCTPKQLEALDLWRRGVGKRRMGDLLDIDPSTARDRVRAGLRRLGRALEQASAG
jgi:DNA-binding CsgD family transcriptional regulator